MKPLGAENQTLHTKLTVKFENEDGKTLQLIPIRLQGIGFKTMVDQEDGKWTIDGYED